MKKTKIVKLIGIIVAFSGLMVMIGWIFNITVLKSILPGWVTMKFTTALCFFLSGILLYSFTKRHNGDSVSLTLLIPVMCIFLIMGSMLISRFSGLRIGVEDLFIKEADGAVRTVFPGMPSIPTMANFILSALAGIFTMLNLKGLKFKLEIIGFIVTVIGIIAVMGYLMNMPALYYEIKRINTAMALHTAVLFVLLGIGLILSGEK